ncbi:wings apart-like protein homolog isoform X2 [Hydra vulgaris]|uniref:Wings apart-like protein homolog isoform X2 n=1 Tax=Hydra vulgaris TaxID=6087 RepID=A0ABM4BRP2_HYDVU
MSKIPRKRFSYGLTKQKKKEISSWRDITRKSLATSKNNESFTSPFKNVQLLESSVSFDNDPFAYDEEDDQHSINDSTEISSYKATPKKYSPKKEIKQNAIKNATSEKLKSSRVLSCESNIISPKKTKVKAKISPKKNMILNKLKNPKYQVTNKKCDVTYINEFDILVVNEKPKSPRLKNHNKTQTSIKRKRRSKESPKEESDDFVDFQVLDTKTNPLNISENDFDLNQQHSVETIIKKSIFSESVDDHVCMDHDRLQDKNCSLSTFQDSTQEKSQESSSQETSACETSSQEVSSKETSSQNKNTKPSSLFSYYNDLKKDKHKRKNIFANSNKFHVNKDDNNFHDYVESSIATVQKLDTFEISASPEKKRLIENKTEGLTLDKQVTDRANENKRKIIDKRRRFSALPTDVTTDSTNDFIEEYTDEEQDGLPHILPETTMFSFHRPDNVPVRVPRKYKHLYVVVKNAKPAHECFEDGQNQQLQDDVEYLLDGLKPSHAISTRCLSALDLALKTTASGFRMYLKAHGVIPKVFSLLEDALEDEQLALCTATLMYTLAKDRSTIDFNKDNIDFLIKLLSRKESKPSEKKDFLLIKTKIQELLEKLEENYINKDSIDVASICRETLLLLTSKRIGNWFKDEVRKLGGLDYLIDTIYEFSKCIQKNKEHSKSYHAKDRYLNFLEDIIIKTPNNQNYLVSYRNGILLESCIRSINTLSHQIDLANDFNVDMQNCLFSTLKIMTDLSHENASGCEIICKEDGSLNCVLRCALHIPQYLPEKSKFNFVAVSLGLLINLVEHSQQNVSFLNATFSPACCESQSSEDIDNFTAVEALMQLFLVRLEMCKEGDLMEELDKLEDENRERDAALHYEDDEFALVCGDRFDDTVIETEQQVVPQMQFKTDEKKAEQIVSRHGALNASEKQDIQNTLNKAHKHMEDSHVAAYTAILIGLLLENNEANQKLVHGLLPDGDFKLMQGMLVKILSFMKFTNATNERGLKVIERIIELYDTCSKKFPRHESSL